MLEVWGRKNSVNVQKVIWSCEEMGVPFQRYDVGGPFGGNHEPEYLALNPNGLIPAISDDGFVLWESNAIVRYLAAKHGAGTLWSEDPAARAEADKWMDWQLGTLWNSLRPIFIGLIQDAPGGARPRRHRSGPPPDGPKRCRSSIRTSRIGSTSPEIL